LKVRTLSVDLGSSETTVSTSTGPMDLGELADVDSASGNEDDHAEEEADLLQYEWQFEILNSLPHARAVALVDHMRGVELERTKAANSTLQLQKTNTDLCRRLDIAEELLRFRDAHGVAAQIQADEEDACSENHDTENENEDQEADEVGDHDGCGTLHLQRSFFKVLAILIAAMVLSWSLDLSPESFGVGVSFERWQDDLQSEERWQLDRMQVDVRNAVLNGQNMVCWKL